MSLLSRLIDNYGKSSSEMEINAVASCT